MSSPTTGKAVLTLRTAVPGIPQAYELKGDQTTVGRHPSNDIVLALDSISRFHSRLDRHGDYYILQDLNSSNGSYVNGERVTQLAIHDGDQVTFGNVEFDFAQESLVSSVSTHQDEPGGKSIVDIRDDTEEHEKKPTTQSFIKAEDVSAKAKSAVISSVSDKKADRQTLVRLNQRLGTLYRLSELLRDAGEHEEAEIFQKVLELLNEALGADRGVILMRFRPEAEQLDVVAVKYRDQPIVQNRVSVSRTILDQVLRDRIAVLLKDTANDDRYAASESIIMNQIRSAICAPMIIGGRVMGVIHIDTSRSDRPFTQEDLEFVMMIATETGVAISHARMAKEAIHQQRLAAVGETVAGISHNVKNILLLSQGGAELLTRAIDRGDINGAKEAWQVVSRGIDKIGKLVRDMLDYSSNKKPELAECDINEMICGIAEEIEQQLIAKGVTLELDLDDDLGERVVDEGGLQKTIMNLIVNAVEAINHGNGQIIVTTAKSAQGDNLVIAIRDNGMGIPKDKLERIFFPFYTTKGSAGTGLGLPMCKKAIEDMGGKLSVSSEENVGTTFTIELPNTQA